MSGLEIEIVALLCGAALAAGFVDAIAGGGGLITVPALLLAGLDPVTAVATNKAQGVFGSGSATFAFARARMIDWRSAGPMAAIAAIGSVLGALAVAILPVDALRIAMPVLLVAMALYFALSRRVTDADAKARMTPLVFALTVVAAVGFYDGLFGPGAGSFYTLGFVTLLGYGAVKATAHTKLVNFASNAGSLALFAAAGQVLWPVGLLMGVCALAGAQVGARLAVRHGARLIRPLIVLVCAGVALRLLLDPAHPVRAWLFG